ncbi:MAG: WhiB family transcriptional regulator [Egibacteraceae bacterium]
MSWRSKAACLDEDTELFFPAGTTGPAVDQTEQAKAICRRCDVSAACLDWALKTGQNDGIRGRLNERGHRVRGLRSHYGLGSPCPTWVSNDAAGFA